MTFELVTTFLNLMAVCGLIVVTMVAIHHKMKIEEHQANLNRRLDKILQEIKDIDQKDINSGATTSKGTSGS
jgi:hypothetical protein